MTSWFLALTLFSICSFGSAAVASGDESPEAAVDPVPTDLHAGHDHSASPLQIMGAVDLVLPVHSKADLQDQNRLSIRSAELSFSAPLDSLFEGTIIFAGHSHGGNFLWDIHEAYLKSTELWPGRTIKVGKFLLGIGRLNQMHQHEWLFTEAPKVHREFFADEAAMDTGLEIRESFGEDSPFELTLGLTNGYCYGHCDQLGRRPITPVHYLRLQYGTASQQTGANYWGYTDFSGLKVWHTGLDFVWKKMSHKRAKHRLQSEIYYRNRLPLNQPAIVDAGTYVYYQRAWNKRWSSGIRGDIFSELNRRWQTVDEKRSNLDYEILLNSTYQRSELTSLRWGLAHAAETQRGDSAVTDTRVEFQIVYMMGAHPAHGF